MSNRAQAESRIAALRAHPEVTLHEAALLPGLSGSALAGLEQALGRKLPPALRDLYQEVGGTRIAWFHQSDPDLAGSLDLLPPEEALFGSNPRAGRHDPAQAFRGMLWNDEFEPAVIARLQTYRVLESVRGESSFVTLLLGGGRATAHLVTVDRIVALRPGLPDVLKALLDHLGAGAIRLHLTRADWRCRIAGDPVLIRVRALLGTAEWAG